MRVLRGVVYMTKSSGPRSLSSCKSWMSRALCLLSAYLSPRWTVVESSYKRLRDNDEVICCINCVNFVVIRYFDICDISILHFIYCAKLRINYCSDTLVECTV